MNKLKVASLTTAIVGGLGSIVLYILGVIPPVFAVGAFTLLGLGGLVAYLAIGSQSNTQES